MKSVVPVPLKHELLVQMEVLLGGAGARLRSGKPVEDQVPSLAAGKLVPGAFTCVMA
jgi:hypothetical protein